MTMQEVHIGMNLLYKPPVGLYSFEGWHPCTVISKHENYARIRIIVNGYVHSSWGCGYDELKRVDGNFI